MPARPQLMVLYTNDAVEVRYKDGSRLNILPCGSAFTYCKPHEDSHPANGMAMVQQRCCYVTSAYKDMVLSALDFRNRFAEQPYICEELLEPDQVVPLFARIKEIAWPKTANGDNIEILQDGSVCITSEDEFASLILSAHRRDFTVCYLSLVSQDKCRERTKIRQKELKVSHPRKVGLKDDGSKYQSRCSGNMPDVVPKLKHGFDEGVISHDKCVGEDVVCEDLNISPITQASCADSPRAMSNASGSPITPQNLVKDDEAKFRPFSTPTEGLEDNESPVCTPYGDTAVFNDYLKTKRHNSVKFAQKENIEGSFIGEDYKNSTGNKSEKMRYEQNGIERSSLSYREKDQQNYKREYDLPGFHNSHEREDNTIISQESFVSSSSQSSCETETQTRCKYCWLTRHISCDECPMNWSQVVKMVQDVAENGGGNLQKRSVPKGLKGKPETEISKLRQIDRKMCLMSQLPQSLPLSCPGQHLHKMHAKMTFDDGKNPLEDPTTFSQGRLKVLLIDGVIYRIVRLPTMKVVEVYPGDGSVLISQGMSAHFFLHIIPHGDKLEQRTYSIKSPPSTDKGGYSIKSLISRAHRFLGYVRQEETVLPASAGLCCWKHEEVDIVEPMSTTVLDECEINGYGKFTALSNGQIRIAFKDRTCLDMSYNFTRRIQRSLNCSENNVTYPESSRMLADKKSGTCRLLLPNGQYQMIDVSHPGVYKRYVDIANEWAEWVNSSPSQRQQFYKAKSASNYNMSVERELQKIQCFNSDIVDNSVLKKIGADSQSGAFKPYNTSDNQSRPSILRNSDTSRSKVSGQANDRTVQIHSPPSDKSRPTGNVSSSVSVSSNLIGTFNRPQTERLNPIGQYSKPTKNAWSSNESRCSGLEGFNSVREALLRTSSAIKDIDQILEKR